MEDGVRKQGLAHIQSQRFGKRWKRVWLMLFVESSCSIARLEFFECKESGAVALDRESRALKKQQDSKKVIRLSEVIRVVAEPAEACPKDKTTFLVETTDKLYVFAVETEHLDDWTHALCETAFPMKRGGTQETDMNDDEVMEDNSLYSSRETLCEFRVCVRRTEAAERCALQGAYVLRTDAACLHLLEPGSQQLLLTWPYRYLRRFGRDKSSFSFEAGRRCDSGEGSFEFDTRQGNALFHALDSAIRSHPDVLPHSSPETAHHRGASRGSTQLDKSLLEPPADKVLMGMRSLNLETREVLVPRKNQVKPILSCPLMSSSLDAPPDPGPHHGSPSHAGPHHAPPSHPASVQDPELMYAQVSKAAAPPGAPGPGRERRKPGAAGRGGVRGGPPPEPAYALPFDLLPPASPQPEPADPLYDIIDDLQVRRMAPGGPYGMGEHLYDQPEGCAAPHPTYDQLEELRGDAWRTMGVDVAPAPRERPYDAAAYAVPKVCRARDTNPYKNLVDDADWQSS